jgi:hypothetical protein
VTSAITFDAGALIAIERRSRNLHVVTSDPVDLRAVDDALIMHVP